MAKTMNKLTSIQISKELHGRLYKIKTDLEKIVGHPISLGKVVEVLLLARPLEEAISDLMLE